MADTDMDQTGDRKAAERILAFGRDAPATGDDAAVGSVVDVTALVILSATSEGPKSVRDLAVQLNLPIASLYRRVRALQSAGVLGGHKRKDPVSGKETMVYEALVSDLRIHIGGPEPTVELSYRDEDRSF